MASVTIRNLSSETHRALKIRAAKHGHSMEAEVRAILEDAARPGDRLPLGTALHELARRTGLMDDDIAASLLSRCGTPAKPMSFD